VTTDRRPLILVTNDDGIESPGLHAAAAAVADLGDLLIVAPKVQQTGMGRALVAGPGIGAITEVALVVGGTHQRGYAVAGSPALGVAHALLELAPYRPDLCVSGINYGENIGATITSSGTVGAALEASAFGVPALAVSFEVRGVAATRGGYPKLDWTAPAYFTRHFATRMLTRGLPPAIGVLNVNVPAGATAATPSRVTRQAEHLYYEWVKPQQRDLSTEFRLRKQVQNLPAAALEPESDVTAFLRDRVVSVTPLSANLTARVDLHRWFAAFE
jgi:5'/3'-nucleotidase